MKTGFRPRRDDSLHAAFLRLMPSSLTHWLGARAISMAPEQIALREGLRAALAVGIMMALAMALGMPLMAWSAFAAFWTCLVDPGGPLRVRLRTLLAFGLIGTVVAAIMSMAAGYGPMMAAPCLGAIVFACGVGRMRGAIATQVGALAAIVAVVAVCYPMPPYGALAIAELFALGSGWALAICIVAWPVDADAPLRQACAAIFREEGRMARQLMTPHPDFPDRTQNVPRDTGAYRREIRMRIELARGRIETLSPYTASDQTRALLLSALEIADRIFVVLIAFEHAVLSRPPSPEQRRIIRRIRSVMERTARMMMHPLPDTRRLEQQVVRLRASSGGESALFGSGALICAEALGNFIATLRGTPRRAPLPMESRPRPSASKWHGWQVVLRHSARLSVSVLIAYGITLEFALPYAYWAMMAVIVVMQPQATATLPRTIERVIGSIAGGMAAAIMGVIFPVWLILATIFPLAAATIAFRAVNYTLLVLFMTQLFVLVTDLVSPAMGWDVGLARSLDNIIGSLVGFAGCLLLWPERGSPPLTTQVADAFIANIRYAIMAATFPITDHDRIEQARRMAGTASTRAEIRYQQSRLEGLRRSLRLEMTGQILLSLRHIAGAASVNWMERSCAPSDTHPPPSSRWDTIRQRMAWSDIAATSPDIPPTLEEMAAMLNDPAIVPENAPT